MRKSKLAAVAAAVGAASLAAGAAVPALAGAAPSHPAAPPPHAAAPHAAAPHAERVWVKDCPTSHFSMHPSSFVVACADGGTYYQHLSWTGWGTPEAVGHGTLWANTCKPDCAAGKFVSEPGTLTLGKVAKRDGRETYGFAHVRPLPPNRHHLREFGYELAYG
ncbi:MAG: hypothetical protein ACYDEN_13245 [Acidimicrobiales bacterium]